MGMESNRCSACALRHSLVDSWRTLGDKGSSCGGSMHGLYNATRLEGHETALLIEGEIDAFLAQQECGGMVSVVTRC